MTYPQAIRYLESFIDYEKIIKWHYKDSLKLKRLRDFLKTIGDPQDSLSAIHIAGTKGKGSTCAFIAYILRASGYKVGLYTSPHLSDFRERIRILSPESGVGSWESGIEFEGMISQKALADLVFKLKPVIEKYNRKSRYGPLSFFEVYTALAFVYFKEKKVDFAVLETGLGGRLDATNVVDPLVAAITPISYDHMQKLGNTLGQIAGEKAGIIKRHSSVISAPQKKEAGKVIRARCKETGAKLYAVGKEIAYQGENKRFCVKGISGDYKDLSIRLLGAHQLVNASVAIGLAEILKSRGITIGAGSIKKGLCHTLWPGRCEVIARSPLVVLDGAQNASSAEILVKAVKTSFKYKRLVLVLGISEDKDIPGVCRQLKDISDEVILTQADNPRAAAVSKLSKYFPGKRISLTPGVKEARRLAFSIADKKDLILVTGSLFVIGEFRNDKT